MPAVDDSRGKGTQLESPAANFAPVTPADDADLAFVTRALFVGTAGDVVVQSANGGQATFKSGDAQYHPIRAARVLATGTTATDIVALW